MNLSKIKAFRSSTGIALFMVGVVIVNGIAARIRAKFLQSPMPARAGGLEPRLTGELTGPLVPAD